MRFRELSRKLRLSRWAIACLAVVVALGSVGITYAGIKGPKPHDKPVPTASYNDPFTWVATNDDGHLDYHDLYHPTDPVDPGDDGKDSVYDYWGDNSSSNDPWGEVPPAPAPTPPAPGDVPPRYTKDVARTTAEIEDNPQFITLVIENAYPCYYSTVFYALEGLESRQGWVKEIVLEAIKDDPLDPNPFDYITVTPTLLKVNQPIPSGGEVMGALHILVKQEAEPNATYKFRLTIHTEGKTRKSGTAYAYGGPPDYTPGYDHCFFDYDFKNWGWTNGELGPGFSGVFPLYVGASDCQPSEEKRIGTVTIDYDGSTATVDYNITDADYTMHVTHLWIGDEPFPMGKNGKYTASPGQYGNTHNLDSATSDQYIIELDESLCGQPIYVIAHAGVYWLE